MRRVLSDSAVTVSQPDFLPAPVRGWNARDSLAQMKRTDAVVMDNWWPGATSCEVRAGSETHSTLPSGKVIQSLLNCPIAGGTKRFAVAQDGVYDFTDPTAPALVYALTNAYVEYTNISIAGEPWLWSCNGVDDSFVYKSSTDTWQAINALSTPALTGLTSSDVVNVSKWKNRVILVKKDSQSFYYLPLNSIGGAASEFDLGPVLGLGGTLVATSNWTLDSGEGPDDYFVAISSEGEVVVYQGTDPSNASTFSLVGTYFIGRPVGKRPFISMRGDTVVLCENGAQSLGQIVRASSSIDRDRTPLTDRIQPAFAAYYSAFRNVTGWQGLYFPAQNALVLNMPRSETFSYQFVMNTLTGAWTRFSGWSARALMLSDSELYFCMNNKVYKAWTGASDSGAAITAFCKQAFAYGPMRGRINHIKLVRPIITASGTINLQVGIDTDFDDSEFTAGGVSVAQQIGIWDTSLWDQAYWSGGDITNTDWMTVAHYPGKAWALRMACSVLNLSVAWPGTEVLVEAGSVFGI
jgi:hypothetical protein